MAAGRCLVQVGSPIQVLSFVHVQCAWGLASGLLAWGWCFRAPFLGGFFWSRMKSQKGRKDSRASATHPFKQSKELRHKPTTSTHAIYSVPPCFACRALQFELLSFFLFFLCGHFLGSVKNKEGLHLGSLLIFKLLFSTTFGTSYWSISEQVKL